MAAAPRERSLLLICADPVGERMAGLGIRYFELARALRDRAAVTVAHGGTSAGSEDGVRLVPFSPHAPHPLRGLIATAQMVLAHPQWPLVTRWLARSRAQVVFDLYDPETLETLELLRGRRAWVRGQMTATTLDRLHAALATGERFVCASEGQRDLWLGAMLALRLLDAKRYDADPSLRDLIDLVPFGVPSEPPRTDAPGPRELIAGIDEGSEIVLWNGGIWRWLDAAGAIRAAAAVAKRRPQLRLVFMGAGAGGAASAEHEARELARALGVLGSVVHFHDAWVPYAERGAWLAQAACVLSAHTEHLESAFAYRTRLLDCFWARVPAVCTAGDDLAELIEREHAGAVAPPGDAQALAGALGQVLEHGRGAYAPALASIAQRMSWQRCAQPLARWLERPPPARRGARGLRAPLGQRLREGAYLAGGRALLARRRRQR